MQHAYELALLGLAHIEGLVGHVPEGQEAGQEESAAACTCDQVGCIQQDCDDGSDRAEDGEREVGRHGGLLGVDGALCAASVDASPHDPASADVAQESPAFVATEFTLQGISPTELWDALVGAIEEGERHGSGSLGGFERCGGQRLVAEADRLDSRVRRLAATNLPEGGERDAAGLGQRLHLGVTESSKPLLHLGSSGNVDIDHAPSVSDAVRMSTVFDTWICYRIRA